jgi:drug/metabolite transporter (DMT)-like permease
METELSVKAAPPPARAKADPIRLGIAFACVYFIWGSTFLAIRFAIETLPPLWMAGVRFLLAGALLYGWVALRGAAVRPTSREWAVAALQGGLFFLLGNGGTTWAEQRVPSGLAALVVATIPLWMALLDWGRGGARPSRSVWLGVALGFSGIALLVVGPGGSGSGRIDPIGALALLIAAIAWSVGSIYMGKAACPGNPLQSNAMVMLAGGVLLLLASAASGEWSHLDLGAASLRSVLSLLYLSVFGSIIAFTAYSWLLQATTPVRVSTYAFVNPVVAVIVGWAFAGEAITPLTLVAGAVIVLAIVIIIGQRNRAARDGVTAE